MSAGLLQFLAAVSLVAAAPHIIHIGAHTGNDPTRHWVTHHAFGATLVEPDALVIDVLRRSYDGEQDAVRVVHGAACGVGAGETAPFLSCAAAQMTLGGDTELTGSGGYISQLGHLAVHEVQPSLSGMVHEHCVHTRVPCVSFRDLVPAGIAERPLLVVIDAERHDADVVEQMLAEGVRPCVLQWENEHLTPEVLAELVNLLDDYECGLLQLNHVCLRKYSTEHANGIPDEIRRLFDTDCWCHGGFGREPFPPCVSSDSPYAGCPSISSNATVGALELLCARTS
jgi:hypothetical protein